METLRLLPLTVVLVVSLVAFVVIALWLLVAFVGSTYTVVVPEPHDSDEIAEDPLDAQAEIASILDLRVRSLETELSHSKVEVTELKLQLQQKNDQLARLSRSNREACTCVESVIAMRTRFDGQPPYVGWEGLGLALSEALDERDRLRKLVNHAVPHPVGPSDF